MKFRLAMRLLLTLQSVTAGLCLSAFAALDTPLTVDPQITIGKLENGLSYYIRQNRKPENRAMLRLVVNAGSILEDKDQQGLAHFIEHMAFNGTRHFEKEELVDYLEGIGMRFGPELNAYTAFDETVYMLEVPMDDDEILEQAFLILQDWADGIAFDAEEIDKERGVIIEEWRLGRGARQRIQDKQIPVLFHESRYAQRLPIGKVEVIETAPRDTFLRFYEKWYRPDLMALIAVGDFSPAKIEALIRKYFEPLTNPAAGPDRSDHSVPDHQPTLFSIETDPELSFTSVQIAYKHPPGEHETEADYRRSIVEGLYTGMLNQRLDERRQEASPPYLYAGTGKMSLVRSKDVVVQSAMVREGQFEEGLRALLREANRVKRDGFTATELERAKAILLRRYEQAFTERDKLNSGSLADEYTRNFLQGEPIPGIAKELELVKESLPGITLGEVNRAARDWITEENRVILYSAPRKPQLKTPGEEEILAILKSAESEEIDAYQDELADVPLLATRPTPGRIVSTEHEERTDVTTWRLSNRIRVLLKPTDFKNDQVLMQAFSPGGYSLVEDEDFVAATTAPSVVGQSGLGEFDRIQLGKKLAGKIAGVSASIGEVSEGLGGSASPRDLETLFQLIHLTFTASRADEKTFASIQARMRDTIRNRLNSPGAVFGDEGEEALYRGHFRHRPMTEALLEEMDREKSLRIYRDRFADAGDFTFVFVGNLDLEGMKPLVKKYLASLPNLDRKERGRFRGDDPSRGRVEVTVKKGLEPKSSVSMIFTGDAPWKDEERYPFRSVVSVLRIRLREVLREDKGGVYGVSVSGGLDRWPKGTFSCGVSFGCDPENADDLIDAVFTEIKKIQEEGPDAETLAKVKETDLRSYEKGLRQNPYWLGNVAFRARHGLELEGILDFPAKPEALTAEQVSEAARKYFSTENVLVGRLFPEEDEATEIP